MPNPSLHNCNSINGTAVSIEEKHMQKLVRKINGLQTNNFLFCLKVQITSSFALTEIFPHEHFKK
jgi:hypothetical protein